MHKNKYKGRRGLGGRGSPCSFCQNYFWAIAKFYEKHVRGRQNGRFYFEETILVGSYLRHTRNKYAHKSANKLAAHTNVALDVYTASTHCSRESHVQRYKHALLTWKSRASTYYSRESHVQVRTAHVKVTCKHALLTLREWKIFFSCSNIAIFRRHCV